MRGTVAASGLRRGPVLVVLLGALGVGLLTTGCSGDDEKAPRLVASARASELLAASKQVAAGASGVVVDGQMVVNGRAVELSLMTGRTAAEGTLGISGGTAQVRLVSGELYVNGDGPFWEALKAGSSEEYADCWVKASPTTGAVFGEVLGLVPVATALERLAPSAPRAEVGGQVVDGAPTVGLRSLTAGHEDIVYVTQGGDGYPVQVQLGTGGSLTFRNWGTASSSAKVPDEPVVDLTGRAL